MKVDIRTELRSLILKVCTSNIPLLNNLYYITFIRYALYIIPRIHTLFIKKMKR